MPNIANSKDIVSSYAKDQLRTRRISILRCGLIVKPHLGGVFLVDWVDVAPFCCSKPLPSVCVLLFHLLPLFMLLLTVLITAAHTHTARTHTAHILTYKITHTHIRKVNKYWVLLA